jgi:hypothetical protein
MRRRERIRSMVNRSSEATGVQGSPLWTFPGDLVVVQAEVALFDLGKG